MEKVVGIWVDIEQAVIINVQKPAPIIKKIESKINSKINTVEAANKIFRFNGHYLTTEKFIENFQIHQTQQFITHIIDELVGIESIVLFGPSNLKYFLQEQLQKELKTPPEIKGIFNIDNISENEMISWVENYYHY